MFIFVADLLTWREQRVQPRVRTRKPTLGASFFIVFVGNLATAVPGLYDRCYVLVGIVLAVRYYC